MAFVDFSNVSELYNAIGRKDTDIRAGWIPLNERSKEVHTITERVIASMERPYGEIVVVDEGLLTDKAFIDAMLDHGVFFWEIEQDVLGRLIDAWLQTIGDCVSMGAAGAAQDRKIIDIALGGYFETWVAEVATEPIYAGSRVEIGKGRLSGDGSIGSWAAKWMTDYGIILRKKYAGGIDLTEYSGARARDWGRPGKGCPDALEPIAKEHPVTSTTVVRDGDTAVAMLVHLNPITVASNRGFTKRRNKDGTCDPSGSWAHQMRYRGVVRLKNGKICVACQNSWGDYLGDVGAVIVTASGREVTLPAGCFLIELEVADRDMLRVGDSHALAGVRGWRSNDPQSKRFLSRTIPAGVLTGMAG